MTGSLQVRRGTYHAVLNLYDKDGQRKPKWVNSKLEASGSNKRKAEKFLRDLLVQEENKIVDFRDNRLFADYIVEWLESHKWNIEQTTYESYKITITNHIFPYFKERKVKLQDIRQFYDWAMDAKGVSANTVKHYHANIRKSLQDAMRHNLVSKNVADLVELPKGEKFVGKSLNAQQLNKLIETARGHILETAIFMTIYYGLRRSEVAGLKWSNVDFANRTITISTTMVKQQSLVVKERTKNKASHRTYPMTDEIFAQLKKLKKKQAEEKLFMGSTYVDNDFVFKWENGDFIKPCYYSSSLKKLLKQAGLPPIRFHDLRHSCATALFSAGEDLKNISDWLGHADTGITAKIYLHTGYKHKVKVADRMTSILSDVSQNVSQEGLKRKTGFQSIAETQ